MEPMIHLRFAKALISARAVKCARALPCTKRVLRVAATMALAIGAAWWAGPAPAANSAPTTQCRSDGTQQDMNECAMRDFRAADAILNITYGEVMQALPQQQRTALRTEQRGWLKARDPACKRAARANEGGSVWPLVFYGCLERSTRERTGEIERWKDRRP